MMNRKAVLGKISILAGIALLVTLSVAHADMLEKLQGNWAAKDLKCETVFKKTDGRIRFAKSAGYKRQGLIIKNDTVEGQNGVCQIISHKDLANGLVVGLSCKLAIAFDKMVVHVRLNNDNELVQFDPDLPELATTYHRCVI